MFNIKKLVKLSKVIQFILKFYVSISYNRTGQFIFFSIIYLCTFSMNSDKNVNNFCTSHRVKPYVQKNQGPFHIVCENMDKCYQIGKDSQWSKQQNLKYAVFIKKMSYFIQGKKPSQIWNLYKYMGDFIQTRNFRQCKLHHQKLSHKFKTIQLILQSFQQEYEDYKYFFNEYCNLLNQFINLRPELAQRLRSPILVRNEIPITIESKGETISSYLTQLTQNQRIKQKNNLQIQSNIRQEWIQCHFLFVQWITRLKSIMLELQRK